MYRNHFDGHPTIWASFTDRRLELSTQMNAASKDRDPSSKLDIQVDLIAAAFRAKNDEIARFPADGPMDFLYRRQFILVRDEYLDRVRNLVPEGDQSDGLIDGVTLYSLAGQANVMDAVEQIDQALGVGVATPDHVMSITPVWPCRPAGHRA